jgi:hypothetical protein
MSAAAIRVNPSRCASVAGTSAMLAEVNSTTVGVMKRLDTGGRRPAADTDHSCPRRGEQLHCLGWPGRDGSPPDSGRRAFPSTAPAR